MQSDKIQLTLPRLFSFLVTACVVIFPVHTLGKVKLYWYDHHCLVLPSPCLESVPTLSCPTQPAVGLSKLDVHVLFPDLAGRRGGDREECHIQCAKGNNA
jgi:hypothetical protein